MVLHGYFVDQCGSTQNYHQILFFIIVPCDNLENCEPVLSRNAGVQNYLCSGELLVCHKMVLWWHFSRLPCSSLLMYLSFFIVTCSCYPVFLRPPQFHNATIGTHEYCYCCCYHYCCRHYQLEASKEHALLNWYWRS